jgi:hypothetical protein
MYKKFLNIRKAEEPNECLLSQNIKSPIAAREISLEKPNILKRGSRASRSSHIQKRRYIDENRSPIDIFPPTGRTRMSAPEPVTKRADKL